ncbi:AAA family ATPase [Gordonia terrae]|uniref:MinD/ParA family ATP-binding protein n=1 Tax=Gordonia terrae TaxID=2055 RepID=UPI003F6D6DA6
MTYENPTTPDGSNADAPAPPPWLQFAPPPPAPAGDAPHTAPQRPDDQNSSGDHQPGTEAPMWRPGAPGAHPELTAPGVAGADAQPPRSGPFDHPIGGAVPPSDARPGNPRPEHPGPEHAGPPHQGPAYQGPGHPGPERPGPAHAEPIQAPPATRWASPEQPPAAAPPHHEAPFFPGPPPGQHEPHDPYSPGSAPVPGPSPAPGGFEPSPPPPVGYPPQPPHQQGGPTAGQGHLPTFPGHPMQPGYAPPQGGPSLDEVALIRKARRAPSRGWRRAVHTLSAGAINPGESQGDIAFQQLLERVNRPVRGDYRIAVLSLKGGVGKTTTTVGLGSTFASLRGDRVIAVDANPDLGTLAQRIPQQTRSTVRDLLADENVYRYSDVRAHTSQAPSRLEVLASERDPAMAEAFNEEEYRGVITVLQRFYNIIITDCGTGLSHSAMNGVLDLANTIILVSSPALDGARSAGATLDWLEAHGFGHLVSRAVVVLSSSRPGSSTIDTDQLGQHFLTRCRAVHKIPFDDHLAEGADVDLELMSKPTKRSFVELAATIADDFSGGPGHREEPFLR